MFGLEDYTWYSQPDGSIWLGSWPDCHWASRPISVTPKLYCGEKAATGVQIPMLPAIRPESQVNGKRISQLMFDGEQLTLQWKQPESQTQREMKQQFPELGTQTHLAQLGRVVAICEPVKAGHRQTPYRPALGVDVQLLNPDGSDNKRVPVFQNVPLPGSLHHGQGQFAFAQPGSIVELGFAFGHSHRPFVRTILGLDWSMPGVSNGDYLCQFNEGLHRIDTGGSQQLHTEQQMTLSSQAMTISSDNQSQRLGAHQRLTEGMILSKHWGSAISLRTGSRCWAYPVPGLQQSKTMKSSPAKTCWKPLVNCESRLPPSIGQGVKKPTSTNYCCNS